MNPILFYNCIIESYFYSLWGVQKEKTTHNLILLYNCIIELCFPYFMKDCGKKETIKIWLYCTLYNNILFLLLCECSVKKIMKLSFISTQKQNMLSFLVSLFFLCTLRTDHSEDLAWWVYIDANWKCLLKGAMRTRSVNGHCCNDIGIIGFRSGRRWWRAALVRWRWVVWGENKVKEKEGQKWIILMFIGLSIGIRPIGFCYCTSPIY